MISYKAKLLCVIAFALTASGCGGGGGDDAVNTDVTTLTEVNGSTESSIGIATPVQSISSVQMDAFVENPLLSDIPTELNGVTSTVSRNFISNPLIQ